MKATLFFRLPVIVFLVSAIFTSFSTARAEDLPRYTLGGEIHHGGSAHFNKAGGDTINLMAGHNDPTNGPGEPAYFGDFEDASGQPDWNGWTHWDITQPTVSHWNISDYNQPVAGNLAAWCGDIAIASCGGGDPDGGYGNSGHDLIEFRQTGPNTGESPTGTVTADLLRNYPNQILGVEGHTDSQPIRTQQFPSGHHLSISRATAVYSYLSGPLRVPRQQLVVTGHGANHPVVSNATSAGKARNPRNTVQ